MFNKFKGKMFGKLVAILLAITLAVPSGIVAFAENNLESQQDGASLISSGAQSEQGKKVDTDKKEKTDKTVDTDSKAKSEDKTDSAGKADDVKKDSDTSDASNTRGESAQNKGTQDEVSSDPLFEAVKVGFASFTGNSGEAQSTITNNLEAPNYNQTPKLTVTVDNPTPQKGDKITYKLHLSNLGPSLSQFSEAEVNKGWSQIMGPLLLDTTTTHYTESTTTKACNDLELTQPTKQISRDGSDVMDCLRPGVLVEEQTWRIMLCSLGYYIQANETNNIYAEISTIVTGEPGETIAVPGFNMSGFGLTTTGEDFWTFVTTQASWDEARKRAPLAIDFSGAEAEIQRVSLPGDVNLDKSGYLAQGETVNAAYTGTASDVGSWRWEKSSDGRQWNTITGVIGTSFTMPMDDSLDGQFVRAVAEGAGPYVGSEEASEQTVQGTMPLQGTLGDLSRETVDPAQGEGVTASYTPGPIQESFTYQWATIDPETGELTDIEGATEKAYFPGSDMAANSVTIRIKGFGPNIGREKVDPSKDCYVSKSLSGSVTLDASDDWKAGSVVTGGYTGTEAIPDEDMTWKLLSSDTIDFAASTTVLEGHGKTMPQEGYVLTKADEGKFFRLDFEVTGDTSEYWGAKKKSDVHLDPLPLAGSVTLDAEGGKWLAGKTISGSYDGTEVIPNEDMIWLLLSSDTPDFERITVVSAGIGKTMDDYVLKTEDEAMYFVLSFMVSEGSQTKYAGAVAASETHRVIKSLSGTVNLYATDGWQVGSLVTGGYDGDEPINYDIDMIWVLQSSDTPDFAHVEVLDSGFGKTMKPYTLTQAQEGKYIRLMVHVPSGDTEYVGAEKESDVHLCPLPLAGPVTFDVEGGKWLAGKTISGSYDGTEVIPNEDMAWILLSSETPDFETSTIVSAGTGKTMDDYVLKAEDESMYFVLGFSVLEGSQTKYAGAVTRSEAHRVIKSLKGPVNLYATDGWQVGSVVTGGYDGDEPIDYDTDMVWVLLSSDTPDFEDTQLLAGNFGKTMKPYTLTQEQEGKYIRLEVEVFGDTEYTGAAKESDIHLCPLPLAGPLNFDVEGGKWLAGKTISGSYDGTEVIPNEDMAWILLSSETPDFETSTVVASGIGKTMDDYVLKAEDEAMYFVLGFSVLEGSQTKYAGAVTRSEAHRVIKSLAGPVNLEASDGWQVGSVVTGGYGGDEPIDYSTDMVWDLLSSDTPDFEESELLAGNFGKTMEPYTLAQAQEGKYIKLKVSVVSGDTEYVGAEKESLVRHVGSGLSGTIELEGNASVGETVTAIYTPIPSATETLELEIQGKAPGTTNWETLIGTSTVLVLDYRLTSEERGYELRAYAKGIGQSTGEVISHEMGPVMEHITGTVTISGESLVGETLTSKYEGNVPEAELGYQWQQTTDTGEYENIPGATSATFTLTADQLNQKVKLMVSGDSASYWVGTLDSNVQGPVLQPIGGTIAVYDDEGQPIETPHVTQKIELDLSKVTPAEAQTGNNVNIQWLRNGQEIQGATDPEYTIVSDDKGTELSVMVSGNEDHGYAGVLPVCKVGTGEVQGIPIRGTVEINNQAGHLKLGEEITTTIDITPAEATYELQWFRYKEGGEAEKIEGATGPTYIPVAEDYGKTLWFLVIGTGDYSNEISDSTETDIKAAQISGEVSIDGNLQYLETLTANVSKITPPDAQKHLTYQWVWANVKSQANSNALTWIDIEGATNQTFVVNDPTLVGNAIGVKVSGVGDVGYIASVLFEDEKEIIQKKDISGEIFTLPAEAQVGDTITPNFENSVILTQEQKEGHLAYEWLVDGKAISDTSASLKVVESMEGKTITLNVTINEDSPFTGKCSSQAGTVVAKSEPTPTPTPGDDPTRGGGGSKGRSRGASTGDNTLDMMIPIAILALAGALGITTVTIRNRKKEEE